MGRKFVRVALGGVRDEAEIRGHRRTYVQPGRIARAIKEAGTMNPVFLLDEVDKVGADWRGDPSSALLEAPTWPRTTPSATTTSRSSSTCRMRCSSPPPTWSRRSRGRCWTAWSVVRLDGYTEDEKLAIARDHLLARQLDQTGLRADEVIVTEAALRTVVGDYTLESGSATWSARSALLRKQATRSPPARPPPRWSSTRATCAATWAVRSPLRGGRATAVPGVAIGLPSPAPAATCCSSRPA